MGAFKGSIWKSDVLRGLSLFLRNVQKDKYRIWYIKNTGIIK